MLYVYYTVHICLSLVPFGFIFTLYWSAVSGDLFFYIQTEFVVIKRYRFNYFKTDSRIFTIQLSLKSRQTFQHTQLLMKTQIPDAFGILSGYIIKYSLLIAPHHRLIILCEYI